MHLTNTFTVIKPKLSGKISFFLLLTSFFQFQFSDLNLKIHILYLLSFLLKLKNFTEDIYERQCKCHYD